MIKLISFGYKHGEPPAADLVLNCRVLRNPHSVPWLRRLDGRTAEVQQYVREDARSRDLYRQALAAARSGARIAFGCFGGRHRSVALVEMTARMLREIGHEVTIVHREL